MLVKCRCVAPPAPMSKRKVSLELGSRGGDAGASLDLCVGASKYLHGDPDLYRVTCHIEIGVSGRSVAWHRSEP
jgi:hypothetical protein